MRLATCLAAACLTLGCEPMVPYDCTWCEPEMIVRRSRLIRGQSTHIYIEDVITKRYPASWIVTGSSMRFLLPDGSQTQRVSDPTASVQVIASGDGESVIEATLQDGGLRLNAQFKVVDSSGIVSLSDRTSITLGSGEETGFKVLPRDAVGEFFGELPTSWMSTDSTVASVRWAPYSLPQNAWLLVVARKPGTAEIIGAFGPSRDTIWVSVVP